nr:pyruvate carboxylase subunit B [Desulfobacterales bacterium]
MRKEKKKEKSSTNPVRIMDLTLRDGHQSLLATRMRTEDMIPIAEEMDKVGFWGMEVWGGATFDSMHRFLNEDPWERPRILKKYIKNTPFSMLLRGQNLVGYRNYADDVVEAFVEKACEVGIDIFRVFDALNDFRNFETSVKVIKKNKKHFQGTICYSLTERRMGGPVFNLEYYISKAKELVDMGADTICIKDMAGLIAPYDAYELISALKQEVSVPIHLHSHYTSGMASMSYLKAIEAGVDIIDCNMAPFALRTGHPAVEPIVVALEGTERDPGFDLSLLIKISNYLETIAPKYRHLLDDTKMAVIDVNVLMHQVPGGMLSNLVNQLRQMDAIDRIDDVYSILPKVRNDLGNPPLVTPTSQIVGTQAVNNVLFDTPQEEYKMITDQVKDYCYGLYGKPPTEINPDVRKKALKGYKRGETPITTRPADVLEPELEKAKEEIKDLAKTDSDVLIYALYPTTGRRFLRWKYGLEEPPADVKPKTLDDVKKEQELIEKAKAGLLVEKSELEAVKAATPKGGLSLKVVLDGKEHRVDIQNISVDANLEVATPAGSVCKPTPQEAKPKPSPAAAAPAPAEPAEAGDFLLEAPMPGMIIRYEVSVGDKVKAGDTIVILEAMKMENALTTEVDGTVKSIPYNEGDSVARGDTLAVIGQ